MIGEYADHIQMQPTLDQTNQQKSQNSLTVKPQNDQLSPTKKLVYIILIGYLYFVQGIILSISATMPYVYPKLPNYDILSLFSLAHLPFSFKFITAPLIEKYTYVPYGKRKFWIILSQIFSCFVLFMMSFYTQQQYEFSMAIAMFISVFFICLQDISLDAMSIKQLRKPHLAAMLQANGQTTGFIFGSLVLMKFSSAQFAQKIGLSQPISTPNTIFKAMSFLILIPTLAIHLFFKQRLLKSQLVVRKKSILKIIKYYKVFCDIKSQFCRYFIIFLVYMQGFNFFKSGYDFELVRAGFQKDDLNTIGNLVQVPILIITMILSTQIENFGILKSVMTYMVAMYTLIVLILCFFPTNFPIIVLITFLQGMLGTLYFVISSIMINRFPITGLSGMFITLLASGSNFGNLGALHLKMIGIFGFYPCSIFGLLIQFFLMIAYPQIFNWMNQGEITIQKQLMQQNHSDVNPLYQLIQSNQIDQLETQSNKEASQNRKTHSQSQDKNTQT